MRTVSRRLLAQVFVEQLLKAPQNKAQLIRSLAAFLVEAKQTNALDMVLADISKELASRGHVAAEVVSARELSASARQAVTALVQSATNARSVELSERIEPSLIGGMTLRVPGRELDSTVKRQLQLLKTL